MLYHNLKKQTADILPVTELQAEMLIAMEIGACNYEEQVRIEFSAALDGGRIKRVLEKIVAAQPMLRCVFRWKGISAPVQIVLKDVNLPLYQDKRRTDPEKEPWNLFLSPAGTEMILTYSHLVMDGWSMGIFFRQLFEGYGKESGGLAWQVRKQPSMRAYFETAGNLDRNHLSRHWNHYLDGYEPKLLKDCLGIPSCKENASTEKILSEQITKQLCDYAASSNTTVAAMLYAAWAVFLFSALGKEDVCFGIITSGRGRLVKDPETIGMYVANLPLRVRKETGFSDISAHILRDISEWQNWEASNVREVYGGCGVKNRMQFMDTVFAVENYLIPQNASEKEAALKYASYDYTEEPSYPLLIQAQTGDQLRIRISSAKNIPAEMLKCYADIYGSILTGVAAQSDAVDEIIEKALQNGTPGAWENGGKAILPAENLRDLILQGCGRYKNKIAVCDREKQYTFEEIGRSAQKGAANLRKAGIGKGERVAVCIPRSAGFLISVYAVILCGGVYVPIASDTPKKRADYILAQANAKAVITDEGFGWEDFDGIILHYEDLTRENGYEQVQNLKGEDEAYILFTSGTTGNPKGAVVSHQALCSRLGWNRTGLGLTEADRQLFKTAVSFDVSLIELFALFTCGLTLYILPEGAEKLPEEMIACIERFGISYLHFVPSMLSVFVQYAESFQQKEKLASLRTVVCSGEILRKSAVDNLKRLGTSEMNVYNLYGPTEAAVDVSFHLCTEKDPEIIPIGGPVSGTQFRILDKKGKRTLPGIQGELCLAGIQLAEGYVNDEELTNQAFIRSPDGVRMYRTGDLAYWTKRGEAVVTGREDGQVKFNGMRIECEELKQVLCRSGYVEDAEIIRHKGGNGRLVVFYKGGKTPEEQIKNILLEHFPPAMVPGEYIRLTEFPHTPHGKLDRKALEAFIPEKQPEPEAVCTQTELALAKIWNTVLETDHRFRKEDHFFSYGGSSLLLIELITRIKNEWDVEIRTAELYERLSLWEMAGLVDAKRKESRRTVRAGETGELRLSGSQKQIALFQLEHPDSTAYNMPVLLGLKEGLSTDRLKTAVQRLLAEENWLWQTFEQKEGEIVFKYQSRRPDAVSSGSILEKELQKEVLSCVAPFHMGEPLVRFRLIMTERRCYLFFDIHHILCDQQVAKRLAEKLALLTQGKRAPSELLTMHGSVRKESENAQEKYWEELYADGGSGCILPFSEAGNRRKQTGSYSFSVDKQKLDSSAGALKVSSFVYAYAAFFILAGKMCGREDVTVGTSTMKDIAWTGQAGMNLEILPVRMKAERKLTFEAFAGALHRTFAEAVSHGGYNGNERLFDVMFVKEENILQGEVKNVFASIRRVPHDSKFDLTLFYGETDASYEFHMDYNAALFCRDEIFTLCRGYSHILEQVQENKGILCKDIEVLEETNKQKLLKQAAGRLTLLPQETVQHKFDLTCKNMGDKTAIYGEQEVSFEALGKMANNIAGAMVSCGVTGKIVGIAVRPSEYYIACVFGILKAGGIFLPLEPSMPKEWNASILRDSGALGVICEKEEAWDVAQVWSARALAARETECNVCRKNEEDIAYCIYTSGSTGSPKGCLITQKGLLNYLQWADSCYCGEKREEVFAFYTSPAVDMTITSTVLPCVYGHAVVAYHNEAEAIQKAAKDERVTILKATPSHLNMLETVRDVSPSIKKIIIGGENLSCRLAEELERKWQREVLIYNEYGPTETVVGCVVHQYCHGTDTEGAVRIGKPIDNTAAIVLDPFGNLTIPGMPGELYVAGAGVARGYLNRPELTEEKFLDNIWCPKLSAKIYATGDIVRMLPDGSLVCLGRRDQQIKIHGYRIEPEEIETAAKEIAGVSQAAVLAEQNKWGNRYLILFVVSAEARSFDETAFRSMLSQKLPYYMIPSRILEVPALPVLTSGKADSGKLRNMLSDESARQDGEIGEYLRSCWEEVLGHRDFNAMDGFFEVGGTSITAVTLQGLISKKYPVEIGDLFRFPSIKTLQDYLETREGKDRPQESYGQGAAAEQEIAIVGVSFMLPGADQFSSLREIFASGIPAIGFPGGIRLQDEKQRLKTMGIPEEDYRMAMTGCLSGIDLFPAEYFRIGKDEADAMDPVHRLFLMTAAQALMDAGYEKEQLSGKNIAVIGAAPTDSGYRDFADRYYPSKGTYAALNHVASSMMSRLQHFYNLSGPSYLVDCACSSGLEAIHNACGHIRHDGCEAAVVGGVNLVKLTDQKGEAKPEVLSGRFHADTFSDRADGTARGEGSIFFVLKPQKAAERDGNKIYAIVKGSAVNNDGFSSSVTAPNGDAQTRVIQAALKDAGIRPQEVGLVECHGTATKLGDPIELQALRKVFAAEEKWGYCALNASKQLFGHLDSISGLLGILKGITSLQYQELYQSSPFGAPTRSFEFLGSPFYLPAEVNRWEVKNGEKRICGISSFGLSGTNVHVLLEQGKEQEQPLQCKGGEEFGWRKVRCWLEDEPEQEKAAAGRPKENAQRNASDPKDIIQALEAKIVRLFPGKEIRRDQNLYELGFDSVSIIQLKHFILSEYNMDIATEKFFGELNRIDRISAYVFAHSDKTTTVAEKEDIAGGQAVRTAVQDDGWLTVQQYALKAFLETFRTQYFDKTRNSREKLLQDKIAWANGRFVTGLTKGMEEFSYPIIAKEANGAVMTDIDGNRYTDFAMGFGANFFGYNHPRIRKAVNKMTESGLILGALKEDAFETASKICACSGTERVSFCNSGTEALMNLVRIARAATERNKVVVFRGSFHGTFDPLYVQKNELEQGNQPLPLSIGTPLHYTRDIIMLEYGAKESLHYLEEHGSELAAVLVEPVQSRHPNLRPVQFIRELRSITKEKGTLLIFDEVITGFRCGLGGAQAYYGIRADLVAYGKIIGGGLPIGVFGGKACYMDLIDHAGLPREGKAESGYLVNTGGTFNGHPLSMAAASEVLDILKEEGEEIYKRLDRMAGHIVLNLKPWLQEKQSGISIEHFCSQFIFTSDDIQKLRLLQYLLIYHGIYVWEGGTCYISTEHTWEQIDCFIVTVKKCVQIINGIFSDTGRSCRIWQDIEAKDLSRIQRLLAEKPDIVEIRPLSPQAVAVLSSNLNNRRTGADVSCIQLKTHRHLEKDQMLQAFERVLAQSRHLRCGIIWRHLHHPILVRYENVTADVKAYENHEVKNTSSMEYVIRDKKQAGFVLEKAPLLTLDLFYQKDDSTILVLYYYASYMDGWSVDLFLKQLLFAYDGGTLPEEMDWQEYDRWLHDGNCRERSGQFFRSRMNRMDTEEITSERMEIRGTISEYHTVWDCRMKQKVEKLANEAESSIAGAFLYCFAKAISGGRKQALIGTTVSGRNTEIAGMEHTIGQFSAVLPFCIRFSDNWKEDVYKIGRLLSELSQNSMMDMAEIAAVTGIEAGKLQNIVYGSTIVFLNQLQQGEETEGEILSDQSYVQVPFRLYVTVKEDSCRLLVTYDSGTYDGYAIQEFIRNMQEAALACDTKEEEHESY